MEALPVLALACLLMEALLCLPGQTAKLPSPTTRP